MTKDLEGWMVICPCTILCICEGKGEVVNRIGRVVPIGTDSGNAEYLEVGAVGWLSYA